MLRRYLNISQKISAIHSRCLFNMNLNFFSKYYAKSHEWVDFDKDVATLGISDHAQTELGEIVHVDLPRRGDKFNNGDSLGAVESVKTAADIYTPIEGVVTEANEKLSKTPKYMNSHPESQGWFVKLKVDEEKIEEVKQSLMDEESYSKYVQELKK
jgi:glycine cleavage system H protein